MEVWTEEQWREAQARYANRVRNLLGDPKRAARDWFGDPVRAFLFTYYRFPFSRLARWDPGTGVVLTGAGAEAFLTRAFYVRNSCGVTAAPETLPEHRWDGLMRTMELLRAAAERPARFGCFGLHEWAMVYRSSEVRHQAFPLRLPRKELEAFVESRSLVCTHFDAYRFFTAEAAPRNAWVLTRDSQLEMEQGGCLHGNMDLYKWAHKFSPWIGTDLVLDCFQLAMKAREIDMRASPYDLRRLGYAPIPIETESGRVQYEKEQRQIANQAIPLRQKLLVAFDSIATGLSTNAADFSGP